MNNKKVWKFLVLFSIIVMLGVIILACISIYRGHTINSSDSDSEPTLAYDIHYHLNNISPNHGIKTNGIQNQLYAS